MFPLNFIKGLFGQTQKSANPAIFGFLANSTMPKMGEKEFLKSYKGWVYACVNAIAQPVADIRVRLETKTKDGWQEVESHPALDILYNVNDFMSYTDLMFGTQAYIELHGNAFWYLARNKAGQIIEIWPLDPTRVDVVKSREAFIAGYIFRNELGEKVPFQVDEIIHFKTFNPLNPYRGIGTVYAAALAIDTDTYASEWQRNFFGNSAMPSALLSSEGTLNDEQYNRIRANWDARFKGVQNAHKMAILEGGLKFTPINPTAKEMQLTDSRKSHRDEILGIFRVPKVILGITEDVNYASAVASEYVFNKTVIKPKVTSNVGKLNEFYLPRWNLDPKKYRFGFDDPVPENQDQKRLDRESGIKNYYLTPNEARKELGLESIEGGDQLYIPMGYVPMGSVQADPDPTPPTPTEQPKEEPKNEPKDTPQSGQEDDTKWVKGVKKVYKTGKPAKAAKYINAETKKLHKVYLGLNKQLKTEVLANLNSKGAKAEIIKAWLLPHKKDNNLINLIFQNYSKWVGLVLNATEEGIERIFEKSGKDGIAEVDVDVEFDLKNPRAVKWMADHALEATDSYTDTMKDDITFILQQGIDVGVSVQDIADSLAQFFDETDDWRAMRIARTEAITSYAQGNLEGYRQSGVVSGKQWLPDSEACDICAANADAGTIDLDDNFPSGDDAPIAHPNCFPAGTKIQTIEGLKNIEDIKEGDKVLTHRGRFMPVVGLSKRWYEGTLVTLISKGKKLTATWNHPILTNRGWKLIKDIKFTDTLFYLTNILNLNSDKFPAQLFKDSGLFSIIRSMMGRVMPVSPIDLDHYTKRGMSKVEIMTAESNLMDEPKRMQILICFNFIFTPIRFLFDSLRSFLSKFLNPFYAVALSGLGFSLRQSGISVLQFNSLGTASGINSHVSHMAHDSSNIDAVQPTDIMNRLLFNKINFSDNIIETLAVLSKEFIIKLTFNGDIFAFLRTSINALMSCKIRKFSLFSFTADWASYLNSSLSHIGSIVQRQKQFKGYVYNFEVKEDHSYVAGSFVVSNCECSLQPVVKKELDNEE